MSYTVAVAPHVLDEMLSWVASGATLALRWPYGGKEYPWPLFYFGIKNGMVAYRIAGEGSHEHPLTSVTKEDAGIGYYLGTSDGFDLHLEPFWDNSDPKQRPALLAACDDLATWGEASQILAPSGVTWYRLVPMRVRGVDPRG